MLSWAHAGLESDMSKKGSIGLYSAQRASFMTRSQEYLTELFVSPQEPPDGREKEPHGSPDSCLSILYLFCFKWAHLPASLKASRSAYPAVMLDSKTHFFFSLCLIFYVFLRNNRCVLPILLCFEYFLTFQDNLLEV